MQSQTPAKAASRWTTVKWVQYLSIFASLPSRVRKLPLWPFAVKRKKNGDLGNSNRETWTLEDHQDPDTTEEVYDARVPGQLIPITIRKFWIPLEEDIYRDMMEFIVGKANWQPRSSWLSSCRTNEGITLTHSHSSTQNCRVFQREIIFSSSFVASAHTIVDQHGFKLWLWVW